MNTLNTLKAVFEKPGIRIKHGPASFATIVLERDGASARVCTHGAHLLSYHARDSAPVLWLSPDAIFDPLTPIRGGIPICWPWFADHPTETQLPAHGFARTSLWTLVETASTPDSKAASFVLRDDDKTRAMWPHPFELRYRVSLSDVLNASLTVHNTGDATLCFSGALHSYFDVLDINRVTLEGLAQCRYLDKVDSNVAKRQSEALLHISTEVDRTYLDTERECVIHDSGRGRRIRIRKTGSRSTVVWNPWQDRAQQMADFPDQGFRRMLCVETANAANDTVELAPGARHVLSVTIEPTV